MEGTDIQVLVRKAVHYQEAIVAVVRTGSFADGSCNAIVVIERRIGIEAPAVAALEVDADPVLQGIGQRLAFGLGQHMIFGVSTKLRPNGGTGR